MLVDKRQTTELAGKAYRVNTNIFSVGQEPRESMKQETLWMKSMEFTNN